MPQWILSSDWHPHEIDKMRLELFNNIKTARARMEYAMLINSPKKTNLLLRQIFTNQKTEENHNQPANLFVTCLSSLCKNVVAAPIYRRRLDIFGPYIYLWFNAVFYCCGVVYDCQHANASDSDFKSHFHSTRPLEMQKNWLCAMENNSNNWISQHGQIFGSRQFEISKKRGPQSIFVAFCWAREHVLYTMRMWHAIY